MCKCPATIQDGNALQANEWISAVLGQCIYTKKDMASFVIGWFSIIFWLCAHFPQIRVNILLRTASGLSLGFVILWLIADALNSAASIVTGQLITSIALLVYAAVMDLVFFIQFIVFELILTKRGCSKKWLAKHETSKSNINTGKGRTSLISFQNSESEGQQGAAIEKADVPSSPEEISSGKPSIIRTNDNSRPGSTGETTSLIKDPTRRRASFVDNVRSGSIMGIGGGTTQVKSLMRARADSIALAKREAVEQMAMMTGAGGQMEISSNSLDPNRGRTASVQSCEDNQIPNYTNKTRRTSWTRGGIITLVTIVILIILVLVFVAMWLYEKNKDNTNECTSSESPPGLYWFGYVVAWICAVLYSTAAVFGARHVIKSKQSDDKTPVFFMFTGLGNLAFFLSVVIVVNKDNFVSRLPYIVSNFCSDALYWTNFALIVYYKKYPGGKKTYLATFGESQGRGAVSSSGTISPKGDSSTDNDGIEDMPKLEDYNPSNPLAGVVVVHSSSRTESTTAPSSVE